MCELNREQAVALVGEAEVQKVDSEPRSTSGSGLQGFYTGAAISIGGMQDANQTLELRARGFDISYLVY